MNRFPQLKTQVEIDREIRRERILFRAARIAEFFAVGIVAYAVLVFGGVMQ